MAERIDVFISSTSRDLEAYRQKVTNIIIRLGMYPIGMEGFNPTGNNALQLCYDKVQEAEVFIGIYAHRYGYAPGDDVTYTTVDEVTLAGDGETGITHLEYEWAIERDLPMLLFVVEDDTPWNPNDIEDEPGKSRLKAFKDMILGKHVVGFFSSPDNLASQVATGLAEIQKQLQPESDKPFGLPRRRDFYKHVQLPPNYVSRQELIEELRLALLGEEDEEAKGTIAFHGMGGIGKSVMARALCEDPAVQAAFPDGILWTSLGQTPNLTAKLREWVEALGGTVSETAPTVDSLKANLAELLEKRTCLLILDDVWQKKHAEVFRVVTENSRLLMTTRDAEIPRGMGADVHPIPSMSLPEAVHMLEEWAGGNLSEADDAIKTTIVEKLGRLPLAIKLAGAQLQKKSPEKWLERFDARKLKSKRAEDIHDSLEQTFGLSLETLDETERKLYAALAIFKEDEPIHEVAIARLWDALDEFDEDDTEELLDDLAARALLEVAGDEYPRAAVLHDLLRDYMGAELEDPKAYHEALLDAYAETQTGEGWHTAPNDGYLYDHLAYHLVATDDAEKLYGLFDTQDWMHVRVPTDGYSYTGYRADIEDAWDVAESAAYTQIEVGEFPELLVECLRYALIYTSINSLSGNYVPAIVAQALKTEHPNWSVERALNIAEQIPDANKKVEMYVAIMDTWQVPDEQLANVQREALTAAFNISDTWVSDNALSALAPHLHGDLLQQAFNAALNLSSEPERAGALTALAPHLHGDLLQQAFNAALNLSSDSDRARVLRALALQLQGDMLEQAFNAALNLSSDSDRARALTALVPILEYPKRQTAVQEALGIALKLEDESALATALIALAPQFDGDSLQKALKAVLNIEDESALATALIALAPQFDGDSLQKALKAVLNIEHESYRILALTTLASQLEDAEQHAIRQQALSITLNISDEFYRADVLIAIAPQLEGNQQHTAYQQALSDVLNISDDSNCAVILSALVPHLQGDLLQQAFSAALRLQRESARAEALTALAPQLHDDQQRDAQQQALHAALNIADEVSRTHALTALAPQLQSEQLQQALHAALNIADEVSRTHALTTLAPQLNSNLLQKALSASTNIEREPKNIDIFIARIPQLSGDQLKRALSSALKVQDVRHRAEVLTALAPYLEDDQQHTARQEALAAALTIQMRGWDFDLSALIALAPQLDGNLLQRAFNAALKFRNEHERALTLRVLAPQLDGDLLQDALSAALNFTDENLRARVLATFLPHVPEQQAMILQSIYQAVVGYLQTTKTEQRSTILGFVADNQLFAPPIFSQATLGEIAETIIEICNEWEWL